jgi:hypothetical protein
MEDQLTMSQKDIDRVHVIRQVMEKRITWKQAATCLRLGLRQIGNLCQRFGKEGARGLLHRLRGQPSNHRLSPEVMERALAILRDPLYKGFGPTFANEKLRKRDATLVMSTPTLRQGMIRAGLWKAHKPGKRHRSWRPRRDCVGMLTQLDGSDHDWFEGRGPRCVLLLYIDDATSRILYGEFVTVENTLILLRGTRAYLKRHGRPIAFYVDKDSIYKTTRDPSVEEALKEEHPITQFTRAMKELDIEVICADSPQAKGRVERSFDTHQDRLVKELRLAGISTMAKANEFLWTLYIPEHNARFAVDPASPVDVHRPLRKSHRLDEILSLRIERTIANDYTVRLKNQFFQILPGQNVRPRQTLQVEIRLDGSMHLRWKDRYLRHQMIAKKPARPQALPREIQELLKKPNVTSRPALSHPWRRYPGGRNQKLFEALAQA